MRLETSKVIAALSSYDMNKNIWDIKLCIMRAVFNEFQKALGANGKLGKPAEEQRVEASDWHS